MTTKRTIAFIREDPLMAIADFRHAYNLTSDDFADKMTMDHFNIFHQIYKEIIKKEMNEYMVNTLIATWVLLDVTSRVNQYVAEIPLDMYSEEILQRRISLINCLRFNHLKYANNQDINLSPVNQLVKSEIDKIYDMLLEEE